MGATDASGLAGATGASGLSGATDASELTGATGASGLAGANKIWRPRALFPYYRCVASGLAGAGVTGGTRRPN